MPISGLLISLDRDPARRAEAMDALHQHPAIEIGEGEECRVPIVVDTTSSQEDRAVWDWLHQQPGISFVDVVYVHFEEGQRDQDETIGSSCLQGRDHAPTESSIFTYQRRGES